MIRLFRALINDNRAAIIALRLHLSYPRFSVNEDGMRVSRDLFVIDNQWAIDANLQCDSNEIDDEIE